MNFFVVSAITNAFTSIILGSFILSQGIRDRTNVIFSAFAFSVGGWSVFYTIWQFAHTSAQALLWCQAFMAMAVFIPIFFFHFIASLLHTEKEERLFIFFGYAFAIVFSAMSFSPLFIAGTRPELMFAFWPIPGLFFTPFLAIWIFYVAYGIYVLWKAYRVAEGVLRSQILMILVGTGLGYAGGGFNYLLWYQIPIAPWPNILVSLYVVMVAYAIFKHKLFNIRTIATELFIFTLWILLFIRILVAQDLRDIIINTGFFVGSVLIGILLTRSVLREVEQRERIEKLSTEKSEFMTFASHEIRNPITAMRGYASLIVDGTAGEVSPQVKDASEKILVIGDTVLALISQFLNQSKIELGQIAYNISDVDLGKAVDTIVQGFQSHATQKDLTLNMHIDFPNLMVKADEAKLREVVGNLIDNSIKYTKEGGITVTVEKRNGMARVVVADTGVGIPQDTLPYLFQKFSRADAQKMNLLGTGLGLYLAKTFIEGMGGKIWAESEGGGKGSRFIIEFHPL